MEFSPDWASNTEYLIGKFFNGQKRKIFNELSNEMKVFYCYRNVEIKQSLSNWIKQSTTNNSKVLKSASLSKDLRLEGNKKFKASDDENSLFLYSRSIYVAPVGSHELSLALGNRSAVLFRLRKYKKCISDVNYSINNFKDNSLYPKLMARKIKALSRLQLFEEAFESLKNLKEFISNEDKISVNYGDKLLTDCMNEMNKRFTFTENESTKNSSLPKLLKGENEHFPYASNAIQLELSKDTQSRRVIARETIELGDVLFVEKPFSSVILPLDDEHCAYCCKPIFAPVSCFKCTKSLYCDYDCMVKAQNTHRWECDGLDFLEYLGVGHLAFRTFLLTVQEQDLVSCERIGNLVSHLNDIPEEDMLYYILTSALLLVYLDEYTDFVNTYKLKSIEEMGFSLLKCIIQIICNAFAVKKSTNDPIHFSHFTYATGLFPSAAMMNHSCEPNILTSFYDNYLLVRASKRIEPGEEIFNCYGSEYRKMNTESRKEILKSQFFFDCECDRCTRPEKIICLCLKCQHPFNYLDLNVLSCSSCSSTLHKRKYGEMLQETKVLQCEGLRKMVEDHYETASRYLTQCLELQRTFLGRCNSEIFENTINLANCYYYLGDYEKSWNCLLSNFDIAENNCGWFDLDFASFIMKTIDVFLLDAKKKNDKKLRADNDIVEKLLNLSEKMLKALDMNFGSWSDVYSSALVKINSLKSLKTST